MIAIRTPATDGPSSAVARTLCSLDDRVRLPDGALVVANELRQDQPLRREVRRDEAADREDAHEQQREREQADLVQERDREHQRRTARVAEHHRRARSELGDQGPARDPEQRDREDLDREDDAHLRRRPGRDEHEPRQREEGHLRAEGRHRLGGEKGDERAAAEHRREA
jgi:hypothetical protein